MLSLVFLSQYPTATITSLFIVLLLSILLFIWCGVHTQGGRGKTERESRRQRESQRQRESETEREYVGPYWVKHSSKSVYKIFEFSEFFKYTDELLKTFVLLIRSSLGQLVIASFFLIVKPKFFHLFPFVPFSVLLGKSMKADTACLLPFGCGSDPQFSHSHIAWFPVLSVALCDIYQLYSAFLKVSLHHMVLIDRWSDNRSTFSREPFLLPVLVLTCLLIQPFYKSI